MKRHIALIVKPPSTETRLEELQAAVAAVRGRGHRVSVRVTFESGDARRYARAAARRGCDVVVAAGGDGTVNEVVNGLARIRDAPLLGVVPMGTGNDFAGGLGLPADLSLALLVAAEGAGEPVDVAEVNGHCFINVSTGGFGAAATQGASRSTKRRLGRLAYLVTGAQRFLNFKPLQGRFRADGEVVHDGKFVFFAVGNARRTGGGTWITPRAEVGDGKLDVAVVRGVSRLDFLALLPDLRAGTHLESPDVQYLRAHTFEVDSPEPIPVNADGESVPGNRFRYRLLAGMLSVAVPAASSSVAKNNGARRRA